MKQFEFVNEKWQQCLQTNKLANFDQLWQLKADWFEEPNFRRGGWSGVVKYALANSGDDAEIFIKRQENHITKTWRHPFKGIATFQKEYNNINLLTKLAIPTLELVYFGNRQQQAILVTKELEGYKSLDDAEFTTLHWQDKRALLTKIARVTAMMHQHRIQHNCFYPKHIFIRKTEGLWQICFIDLEKLKQPWFQSQAVFRDLYTLQRHSDPAWTTRDKIHFLKAYKGERKLSTASKKLWHKIETKISAKSSKP